MPDPSPESDPEPQGSPTVAEIRDWLVSQVAAELQVDAGKIQADQPIQAYGIDSMQVVTVIAALEDWLGFRFASNPLDDHPTIAALAEVAAEHARGNR